MKIIIIDHNEIKISKGDFISLCSTDLSSPGIIVKMKNDKDAVLSSSSRKKLTIRLLNGPLSGCEFELTKESTLFIVAPEKILEQGTHILANAFIIPLEEGGVNFQVINDGSLDNGIKIREQRPEGQTTTTVKFHTTINIGLLKVVIKTANEAWLPEINQPIASRRRRFSLGIKKKILTLMSLFLLLFTFCIWLKGGAAATLESKIKFQPIVTPLLPQKLIHSLPEAPSLSNVILTADDAENALRGMSLTYTRSNNNNNNVNFIISGLINDESLQQLKLLVVSYKDQPVNFTVNLQDDYRANKSFKFGNQGYIKISPEHWLINKL
jgi:hypothetical protein